MDSAKNPSVTRRSIMQMTGAALVLPAVPVSAQALEKRRMFTPTFVDFVRNYTSTTGTGNFVLEAAVNGYQSFAGAVNAGDAFYYSATGIDRPAEFEVGRGTMQEDGTIKREPLGGAATDFSKGYKTVALVAAAEWYQAIHAGTAAAPVFAVSRDGIASLADKGKPALLQEPRREGIFIFDGSNLSAAVAADPRQAVYIAPASDRSGAAGAWVRNFGGPAFASWFGVTGDGTTDDHAAIAAMLSFAGDTAHKHFRFAEGTHKLSAPLAIPDNVTIEGQGRATVFQSTNAAGQPWLFNVDGKSGFTIRNIKLTPNDAGATSRSAILLSLCQNAKIEDVIIEGQTNTAGIYLFDCDNVVVDNLYFDGGVTNKAGTGVYNSGGRYCKVVNSHAVNCFAGFTISSAQTDEDITPVASPRGATDTYGNTIDNCTIRNCTTQSVTITGATYSTVSACHAVDYAGDGTHKAFQAKDTAGPDTRGNIFIGCTVINYPAGFGGQKSSYTQFIGCTTRNNSTNGFELNGMNYSQVIGCAAYEFGQTGVWLGSGSSNNTIDDIRLDTSTADAKAIFLDGRFGGQCNSNTFDKITTSSTLGAFISIDAGQNNNRFGFGCRSNLNPIDDDSGTSVWPLTVKTDVLDLASGGSVKHAAYQHRGMHVAAARFVVTSGITGSPTIQAGTILSNAAIAATQTLTGIAGATVLLSRNTSEIMSPGSVPQGRVSATATSGAGFVQFEGLPLL